jgi:predicted Zn-dependent protease
MGDATESCNLSWVDSKAHLRKMTFLITTEKERTDALGGATEKWMDTNIFDALLTKTTWLEENQDKRNSFPKYQKMIRGGRQALPLTNERKIIYIYAMDNLKQCSEVFYPFVQAFFYPLQVEFIDWTNHPFPKAPSKSKFSKQWSKYTNSDSEDDVVSQKVAELMGRESVLQYAITDINDHLKQILPDDGYCALALTGVDIYEDGYNYIIGKATLRDRVGVVSFARYTPGWDGFIDDESEYGFNWRVTNVIAHEICHSLGIAHCVYYHCIMNGSDTGDDRPIFLCSICLKKLAHNIGHVAEFNAVERYEKLIQIYEKNGFKNDVEWLRKRCSFIQE